LLGLILQGDELLYLSMKPLKEEKPIRGLCSYMLARGRAAGKAGSWAGYSTRPRLPAQKWSSTCFWGTANTTRNKLFLQFSFTYRSAIVFGVSSGCVASAKLCIIQMIKLQADYTQIVSQILHLMDWPH